MSTQIFPVGPWPKGVNLLNPPGTLEPEELARCENFRLDQFGWPYKRPGTKGYGTEPHTNLDTRIEGLHPVNFLFRFYKSDNTKYLVAAAFGSIAYGNDATGEWSYPGGFSGHHATNLYTGAVYKDRLYIADGSTPRRWEGGAAPIVNAGHPSATPTLTNGASPGAMTAGNKYKYMVVYVCGNMGAGPGVASAQRTVGAGETSIHIQWSRSIYALGITEVRIYRTKNNGEIFYYLATHSGPVTDTMNYDDLYAVTDANLGEEYVPSHVPPADARFVLIGPDDRAYWFGRTGANASVVEVSEVGWPDRILDDDFFTINNNDGDVITAGCKVPGGLLFFKRNSTWLVRQYGSAPINISYYYGCTAPFSIQITPDGCIFLSQQGKVCVYNGSITEIAENVKPELRAMSEASMNRVCSAYHEDIYLLAYDYRGQKGYNTRVLEYDLKRGRWMGPHSNLEKLTISYFCVFDSAKDNGELFWGESNPANGSFVYQQDPNSSKDYGVAFPVVLQTGQNVLPGLETKEIIKSMVRGLFSGDAGVNVSIITEDGVKTTSSPVVNISDYSDIYGTGKYGTARYGGLASRYGEDSFDIPAKSHQPVVEITDGGNGSVLKLDSVSLLVKPLPLP